MWQFLLRGVDWLINIEFPLSYVVASSYLCVSFLIRVGSFLMKNLQGLCLMPVWNKGQSHRIPHESEFVFSIQLAPSKGQEVSSLAAPQYLPPRTLSS